MHILLSRQQWLTFTLVAACLVVGAWLRLQNLGQKSIAPVEIFVPGLEFPPGVSRPASRYTVHDTLVGIILIDEDPNPVGFYLLMLGWTRALGTSLLMLRLPSVFWGVGSIVLIYWLGTLEKDRWTGIIAAAMLAFHGYMIYWSQIAKMYSLGCFWGLLSTLALVVAARQSNKRWLASLLYVGATLGGLATVVHFWLLFATQICWVFLKIMSKKSSSLGLFRLQILVFIVASPLLALALFQSRRPSYLEPNPLPSVVQFFQFGFLFIPDSFAIPPRSLAWPVGVLIFILTLLLLWFGLKTGKSSEDHAPMNHLKLPTWLMAGASLLMIPVILRLAQFTYGLDADRTKLMVASSIVPLLLLAIDFLLRRNEDRFKVWRGSVGQRLPSWLILNAISPLLALLPLTVMALLAPKLSLLAPRTALLFVPFLLVVLAMGATSLSKRKLLGIILLPLIVLIFGAGVVYNKNSYFEHPIDYKILATQLLSKTQENDLFFVRRHWITTPLFYYLNGDHYHWVAEQYTTETHTHPAARVWLLSIEGLPMSSEMTAAVQGYQIQETVRSLRITATLYTPPEGGRP